MFGRPASDTCSAPREWAMTPTARWLTAGAERTTCPNLYIIDGGVFMSGGSANPTATIMANTLPTVDRMIDTRSRQEVTS